MAKTIIVSLHGILTYKHDMTDWEEEFGRWLAVNYPSVHYVKFKYGWIGPVWAWLSTIMNVLKLPNWVTDLVVQKVPRILIQLQKENPDAKIHIVAHSYGTWVTWRTLLENSSIKVQSVTLVASVISAHIERNRIGQLLKAGQIKSVFVWCSHDDEVVRLIAIPPFGHLGYWGILRKNHPEDRVFPLGKPYPQLELYNHLTDFEHDGYFVDSTLEQIMKDITYSELIP
jgi:pimeloyl-ACP methyl ester carboxylesterase